jgi:hypothetical protein
MRVKRIGTLKTYRKYEGDLMQLLPKYLAKSKCDDTVGEILSSIRMECHNPFHMSCVVLDDSDSVIGFVIAYISITIRGKRIVLEHMYAPNLRMSTQLYDMLVDKLDVDDVWWITHRDPSAWIKFSQKQKRPAKLYGWMVKSQDLVRLGQEKED